MTDTATPPDTATSRNEAARAVDFAEAEAMQRWMRRQRMLSPFRSVLHRLRAHEVGRYACFTCDMDLPR